MHPIFFKTLQDFRLLIPVSRWQFCLLIEILEHKQRLQQVGFVLMISLCLQLPWSSKPPQSRTRISGSSWMVSMSLRKAQCSRQMSKTQVGVTFIHIVRLLCRDGDLTRCICFNTAVVKQQRWNFFCNRRRKMHLKTWILLGLSRAVFHLSSAWHFATVWTKPVSPVLCSALWMQAAVLGNNLKSAGLVWQTSLQRRPQTNVPPGWILPSLKYGQHPIYISRYSKQLVCKCW